MEFSKWVRRHQVTKALGSPPQPLAWRKPVAKSRKPPCMSTTVPYWSNMHSLTDDFRASIAVTAGLPVVFGVVLAGIGRSVEPAGLLYLPAVRPISGWLPRGSMHVKIGVPKEIKTHEYRVGLTPAGARELVQQGHQVVVEHDAGSGIGYSDDVYRSAGAAIADTAAALFAAVELVVKVK